MSDHDIACSYVPAMPLNAACKQILQQSPCRYHNGYPNGSGISRMIEYDNSYHNDNCKLCMLKYPP